MFDKLAANYYVDALLDHCQPCYCKLRSLASLWLTIWQLLQKICCKHKWTKEANGQH